MLLLHYCLLGNCSSYFVISPEYIISKSFTFIHLFLEATCILWSQFCTDFYIFLGDSILFLGRVRNNLLFLNPQPKQNIVLWHLPKRLFGYVDYLRIWEFHFLILLLCIVTTRVLFRLLKTQFFINKLSTLRSIVILLIIISSMTPLLCRLFHLSRILQISLPSRIPFLVFVF